MCRTDLFPIGAQSIALRESSHAQELAEQCSALRQARRSRIAAKISATTFPFGFAPRLALPCGRTFTLPASMSRLPITSIVWTFAVSAFAIFPRNAFRVIHQGFFIAENHKGVSLAYLSRSRTGDLQTIAFWRNENAAGHDLEIGSRTVEDRERRAYRKPASKRQPNRWNRTG